MNGRLAAYWYVDGIPIYRPDTEALEPDFDNEAVREIVHYKGSDRGGAVHANGFTKEVLTAEVRVHENNHQSMRAKRLTSVTYRKVKNGDERTATLADYNARREGGTCFYLGTMTLVEV